MNQESSTVAHISENLQSQLKKLILDRQTISILKYIRNNQVHARSITKEEIARYMDEKQICSRPTTLKLIQRLLDDKIIMNNKKRDNTFSSLIIDPSFDFRALETDILTSFIKEIQEHFQDFNDETGGANTILIDNLLVTLDNFSKSRKEDKDIFTSEQMEKIALDVQNKIVDQGQKRLRDQVYPPRKTKTRRK